MTKRITTLIVFGLIALAACAPLPATGGIPSNSSSSVNVASNINGYAIANGPSSSVYGFSGINAEFSMAPNLASGNAFDPSFEGLPVTLPDNGSL